jgi:hypothetical protein
MYGYCELEGIEREVVVLCSNVLSRYSLEELKTKLRENCGLTTPQHKPDALLHQRSSSAVLDYF